MSPNEQKTGILAFKAIFKKYKENREKVPLKELNTRYARSYKQLLDELETCRKWFIDGYLGFVYSILPFHKADQEGYGAFKKKWEAICAEEMRPGCLYDQQKTALYDRLNFEEFEDLVYKLSARLLEEAYDPYWQRHCIRLESGEIYNDIIKKYWRPIPAEESGQWHWTDRYGKEGPYWPPRT